MRRKRKPVRPWQFWRRAFWTRPILLVCYGLMFGAAGAALLVTIPDEIGAARAMARAPECPRAGVRPDIHVGAPDGCLERIEVTLDGPHYRRGPGSEWWLEIDGRVYDDVHLSTAASNRLRDGDVADVLLWEGDPVVIEPSPGERVETDSWGHTDWLMWMYIGMGLLSGLPMLLQSAKVKRSMAGGWWSLDGEESGLLPALTPLMAAASVLFVPAALGIIPLAVGARVLWSAVLALAALALVGWAVVRQARRGWPSTAETPTRESR